MTTQAQFLLSLIAYYLFIGPLIKALRDIISFRWSWSILNSTRLPRWLRQYLTDTDPKPWWKSFDGWHQSDGALMMGPLVLLCFWGNRLLLGWPFGRALLGTAIEGMALGVLFYSVFYLLYHYGLMKRKYREK